MRASDADRERIARVLSEAMEQGRLTPTETSERLASVYSAKTLGDLEPLTADLPEHAPLVPRPPTLPRPAASSRVDRSGAAPTSSFAVGILSGATRKGRWIVPRQFSAVAIMGGIEIDLTQARFTGLDTVMTCVAFWGGVEIVVPDDLTVVVSGVGLMGSFEDNAQTEGPPGGPVVRINGVAIMGAVEVKRRKRSRAEIERGEIPE
jgi:hypothetical protein